MINAVHHSESGWGYIAYRDRMRSNLVANRAFSSQGTELNGSSAVHAFNEYTTCSRPLCAAMSERGISAGSASCSSPSDAPFSVALTVTVSFAAIALTGENRRNAARSATSVGIVRAALPRGLMVWLCANST